MSLHQFMQKMEKNSNSGPYLTPPQEHTQIPHQESDIQHKKNAAPIHTLQSVDNHVVSARRESKHKISPSGLHHLPGNNINTSKPYLNVSTINAIKEESAINEESPVKKESAKKEHSTHIITLNNSNTKPQLNPLHTRNYSLPQYSLNLPQIHNPRMNLNQIRSPSGIPSAQQYSTPTYMPPQNNNGLMYQQNSMPYYFTPSYHYQRANYMPGSKNFPMFRKNSESFAVKDDEKEEKLADLFLQRSLEKQNSLLQTIVMEMNDRNRANDAKASYFREKAKKLKLQNEKLSFYFKPIRHDDRSRRERHASNDYRYKKQDSSHYRHDQHMSNDYRHYDKYISKEYPHDEYVPHHEIDSVKRRR